MRLIAHRGFAAENPENTLRAVRVAAPVADAIEVDVRRCATGELVVIHDATVDRVSDGTGRVLEHSLAELRALDVLGTGAGVPTLAAVLAAVPDGVDLNVELKESGTAADALSLLDGASTETWISAFAEDVLVECRAADPTVPRAYLTPTGDLTAVETAVELGCTALHPAVDVCDETLVAAAHESGLAVNAWTVEDRETARTLADIGVDGVIADRPDVLDEEPP